MTGVEGGDYSYASSGVDIEVEEQAADILYQYSRRTWPNRDGRIGPVDSDSTDFFSGRFVDISGLPDGAIDSLNSDGVGTKPYLVKVIGRYDTIGTDLVVMVADDGVLQGCEPAHMNTVLTVNTLGRHGGRLEIIEQLAAGLLAPSKQAGIAITNGELAQHPEDYPGSRGFEFDWSATVRCFGQRSRLINGSGIKAGDFIVGLFEPGLRCNGISAIRDALRQRYGSIDWSDIQFAGQTLGEIAIQPSTMYAPAILDMTGGYAGERKAELLGAANITGGGIPKKLGRLINRYGLGAVLFNPMTPNPLFLKCQDILGMSDYQAYRAWHMGQGMLLVVRQLADVMAIAHEHGHIAEVVGAITDTPGIKIASRGRQGTEVVEWLSY